MQEIAGKVWKKEDELKQLKSELAALDRKIQLELAPPTPETAEKEKGEVRQDEHKNLIQLDNLSLTGNHMEAAVEPPSHSISDHIIIARSGIQMKNDNKLKGVKM